ncbi:LuxR C-terminal-related transcriptional regulator [Streptomyces sp. NPDC001698]
MVARQLGIAERTVKGHVARIVEKMGLASRMQAVAVAVLYHRQLCPHRGHTLPLVPPP